MPIADPPMQLATTLGEGRLLFMRMTAAEELSRLYEFDVLAIDDSGAIEPASILGKPASVSLRMPDSSRRYFHGLVCQFGMETATAKRCSHRLILRPWLWLLTRRHDTRVFQKLRIDEILKRVFEPFSADFEFRLSGTYQAYEYCVQYRETDFDFVSRLMEQEGIYYFFSHSATKHTLVVVDNAGAHAASPVQSQFRYRGGDDADGDIASHDEAVHEWKVSHEIQSGKTSLSDFDFEQPRTSLAATASAQQAGASPKLEFYDFPGTYRNRGEGERYARVRLEELQARQARVAGRTTLRAMATGFTFTLQEHPRPSQNARHLVLSTHIECATSGYESGVGDSFYRCGFTALEGTQRFRPHRSTPKPHVPGLHTGIVVGPPGEEIHTDKHGRVKVQFHWDRQGKSDADSSCWIRVSSPWAGKGWGMIALPRIGQEVVVDFIEGDADRPLITGRVYNGENAPPHKLPEHGTVSTIKSRSSKGGSAADFNELRFEDRQGGEYVWFQAQKDYYQYVKQDASISIDRDGRRIVKRDVVEEVKRDASLIVGRDLRHHTKGKSHTTVDGEQAVQVGGRQGIKASGGMSLESGTIMSLKSAADSYWKVGANLGVEAGANVHIKGGATLVIEAGAMITLKAGGGSIVIGPIVTITGTMVNINSGGAPGAGLGAHAVAPGAPSKPSAPAELKDPIQ